MLLGTALSKNGVPIRLTSERLEHIISSHKEISEEDYPSILDVVEKPDVILKGDIDELLAVKKKPRTKYFYVVIYKEIPNLDGFVITAYITSQIKWLFKRKIIWNKR
jgi:hypothetical protein